MPCKPQDEVCEVSHLDYFMGERGLVYEPVYLGKRCAFLPPGAVWSCTNINLRPALVCPNYGKERRCKARFPFP